jgi:hypothetical protein
MYQEKERLVNVSNDLVTAPLSSYSELLARRRVVLDMLANGQEPPCVSEELASALRAGHDARSRILVEIGTLRAKLEDLRRLYTGLGQLRPTHPATPSLDVRL